MEEYMKNEEKLAKDQTIIEEDVKDDADVIGMPSTLNLSQAMNLFQQKNIQAVKDKNNPFFKSTYADLTSIINAVNQGAEYGLAFSQSVHYERVILDRKREDTHKDGTVSVTTGQAIERDIYVETFVWHKSDVHKEDILTCRVPVLIKGTDKDDPQKMGSAITYAKRYGLQALFGLGQDDDGNLASGKGKKDEQ
jgi:hypothetical protein|tara:strand:+ start:6866 stop:7447 length:582 start_codon:yes stop_codon:yes gene_type:complete